MLKFYSSIILTPTQMTQDRQIHKPKLHSPITLTGFSTGLQISIGAMVRVKAPEAISGRRLPGEPVLISCTSLSKPFVQAHFCLVELSQQPQEGWWLLHPAEIPRTGCKGELDHLAAGESEHAGRGRSVCIPVQRIELERGLTQLAKEKPPSRRNREGRPLAGWWEGKQPVN